MLDEAATHRDWKDAFPEENYYFLVFPGQTTSYLQPLDSGPAFGKAKTAFKTPGCALENIVNVLAHFPIWVGSRLSCWKARFKKLRGEDFPWEELCGVEEDETEEELERRFGIMTVDDDDVGMVAEDSWAPSDSDEEE
jgi:hypothetical protein